MLLNQARLIKLAQRLLILTIFPISLGACSTSEVRTKPVEKAPLETPKVDRVQLDRVDWIIITEDNYLEVFERLRKRGKTVVLFALTDQGYENLSVNMAKIKKLVQQQRVIIIAYEKYYKNSNPQNKK